MSYKDIDLSLIALGDLEQMKRLCMIPLGVDGGVSRVGCKDLEAAGVMEEAVRAFRTSRIVLEQMPGDEIARLLARATASRQLFIAAQMAARELKSGASGSHSAVLGLIEEICASSVRMRASDIHIEPLQNGGCAIRCRIDGVLGVVGVFDNQIYQALLGRIKMLCNIDIAQRLQPQDGRCTINIDSKNYDLRLSTLPVMGGESVVMRLLGTQGHASLDLKTLGFSEQNLKNLSYSTHQPHGIILVTGPTGSGKTTTLYAALNAIKSPTKKIISVEDPIEYALSGIQQVSAAKGGVDFNDALRSVLRQDPDIIMIGEIRDAQTLQIAMQAALTGHLVLATLHTNDAASAVARMRDLGAPDFMVSGTALSLIAQRLIRRLCPVCKRAVLGEELTKINGDLDEVSRGEREFLGPLFKRAQEHLDALNCGINLASATFFEPVGCDECAGSGYSGREVVSEVLTISPKIEELIASGAYKGEILNAAKKEGFSEMLLDGVKKAQSGISSLAEILRVVKV